MLESQYSLEGSGHAHSHRKHHFALRQVQSRLVVFGCSLQPRTHPKRRDCRQNRFQKELGSLDAAVLESRARAPELVSQGRALYLVRRGRCHLFSYCALAGIPKVCANPLSAPLVQARHQVVGPGLGEAQGGLFRSRPAQPKSARRTCPHRASLRQPTRDPL